MAPLVFFFLIDAFVSIVLNNTAAYCILIYWLEICQMGQNYLTINAI